MQLQPETLPRASTGIPGPDDILTGGLARNRLHLLEGSPGTGKATIALQFLMAAAAAGEVGIYISLAETEHEFARRRPFTWLGDRSKSRDRRIHPAGKRVGPATAP
jgi:KaiC/GvpD/RAD55 family RecA-like ATPase